MRKYLFLSALSITFFAKSQIGIGTNSPKGVLHIDAKKDNVASPNSTQALDDVTVSSTNGALMVGGISQAASNMEINSGVANTSGLRFRNLTSTSPNTVSSTQTYLGVDDTGNVIISGKDMDRAVTTIENNITSYNAITRNNDGSLNTTLIPFDIIKLDTDPHSSSSPFRPSVSMPGSEVNFTIPNGRPRAVFMNFMMGFALTSIFSNDNAGTNGAEVFGAEIILVNNDTGVTTPTGVMQTTQVPSPLPTRQMYAVNYITNLPAGNYTAKIRINTVRFLYGSSASTTIKTIRFTPLQYSYNISYFES